MKMHISVVLICIPVFLNYHFVPRSCFFNSFKPLKELKKHRDSGIFYITEILESKPVKIIHIIIKIMFLFRFLYIFLMRHLYNKIYTNS